MDLHPLHCNALLGYIYSHFSELLVHIYQTGLLKMPRSRPRPSRLPSHVIDELKDRLYRYTLKFQRIADRLRESRIPEDEFTRINAIAQGEWGPGRLCRIPKADNEEERRAFFQMIEDRYALVDSTTDYLE